VIVVAVEAERDPPGIILSSPARGKGSAVRILGRTRVGWRGHVDIDERERRVSRRGVSDEYFIFEAAVHRSLDQSEPWTLLTVMSFLRSLTARSLPSRPRLAGCVRGSADGPSTHQHATSIQFNDQFSSSSVSYPVPKVRIGITTPAHARALLADPTIRLMLLSRGKRHLASPYCTVLYGISAASIRAMYHL
jgi:hypothetical protein